MAVSKPRVAISEYLQDISTTPLFFWALLVLFVPFYVFDSGLPQPGHFVLLIAAPMALRGWDGKLSRDVKAPLRPLFWFTFWVCAVNYGWAMMLGNWTLYGKTSFVIFPIYYVFNAVVFLCVLVLHQRFGDRFLRVTVNTVFIAVAFQVVWSFFLKGNRLREAVFFNNANQLGYYALLASSVIAICQKRLKISMLKASIGVTMCAYLALLSASRAAAGGVVVVFLVTFVSNPRILLATIPIVVAALAIGGPVTHAIEATQYRISNDQFKQWTFFEERGYGRLEDNPEYVLIGGGEGGTDRFQDSLIGTHEIHSSPAAILFSYGLIGSALILTFMFRVFRGSTLKMAILLMPIVAYIIAHVGMRAIMLWTVLAIFTIVKRKEPSVARVPTVQPAPAIAR